MLTLFKKLAVSGLSAAVLAGSLVPAQAMPLPALDKPAAASEVTQVQYRDWDGRRDWRDRGDWRDRRDWRESRRDYRRGYREGYYNGHRGYRDRRAGYRYHEGYWFPLAAFAAGAVIGGAVAAPRYVEPAPAPAPVAGNLNPRHYDWCATRYRSYDSYSNTFQPYNGPRQQCLSPYY
ncbi:BA14K family protein [Rhizobium sp. LC145]|uniref:BA14K family protein n=1 Tax=Rhizobium sp. LC145 TaxID=1120688 RepID=UPI000629EB4A|nr:BA14K family protein [Rhizobium sp. LC145]KKX28335.1 membrane protein [Rhizobium sp. LC145]TKT58235.1 BA14K family protein [Rhizobiaceae bacterium LC148]